jgi:hypothetical protein
VHFREILSGYFLFSRFDWSIFVRQLVAKHMKEIIMNICSSEVKTIFTDKILATKLLWRLMTFLTVQLLFDKLSHTFLMLLFFMPYLTRKFLKHTV